LALTGLIATIAISMVRHQLMEINLTIKRMSLIVLIYVFLISFSIPVFLPLIWRFLPELSAAHVAMFVSLSMSFGIVLSSGPLIYAYLERHTYWLKRHVTTGLTHELKSPISSIRGAVDMLQDQRTRQVWNEPGTDDYLAMIDKNTTRLESYVRDLLHVAKAQEGAPMLDKKDADLVALIRHSKALKQEEALAKSLTITINAPDQINVLVDQEKMLQTLSNILSNAIKFSRDSEIHIDARLRSSLCTVQIRDHGEGIAAAQLDRVFERFYQGRNSNKGSGIGLTIAKAWVEAHGGKIWAESEGEGKGTTVTFTVPL
jgi:two-component system phosphate regulon sensor histidine kinase PhoR